jgi:hypothetical protein
VKTEAETGMITTSQGLTETTEARRVKGTSSHMDLDPPIQLGYSVGQLEKINTPFPH